MQICCPEEIAFENDWITGDELKKLAEPLLKCDYGRFLMDLVENN